MDGSSAPLTLSAITPAPVGRRGWSDALMRLAAPGLTLALPADDRIPVALLAALPNVAYELRTRGHRLTLVADATTRDALATAGCEHLVEAPSLLPAIVTCSDTAVRIRLERQSGQDPRIALPAAFTWISRIDCQDVQVDLSEVVHMNSVTIAWLLQLAQVARPVPVSVHNVNRPIAIQFAQLRLDHLVQVHEAPEA